MFKAQIQVTLPSIKIGLNGQTGVFSSVKPPILSPSIT